ncbi:MAG TPA: hypothetical protein VJY85_11275 [Candidatus Limnocylindria bacterium]|nr:hypothetical protein [Candidatus Limnocylindria bacterium]
MNSVRATAVLNASRACRSSAGLAQYFGFVAADLPGRFEKGARWLHALLEGRVVKVERERRRHRLDGFALDH